MEPVSSLDVNLWTEEDYEKEARWVERVLRANAKLSESSNSATYSPPPPASHPGRPLIIN